MTKLILMAVLVALVSCQPIMLKLYGIKDPDIENRQSITKKALKYHLDTTNIVIVNSKDFPKVLNAQEIPDCAIYDRNGKYVEYRQSDTSCNAGLFEFIPSLSLSNNYNQPDSADLHTELRKFTDWNGNALPTPEKADFYLLIYWTVWTGKLNKDHVRVWENLAKANRNCHIKVIKVNLDIQETWNEKDRNLIYQAIRKRK